MLLTAINLSVGPIISKRVGKDAGFGNWATLNCEKMSDDFENAKRNTPAKTLKYGLEWKKDECYRKKAMYNLEYSSFIIDICLGFVCSLLMLLHLMGQKQDFVPKTGLIGFCCGIVGFIITFVYVVYNGIVYTTYYDYGSSFHKKDKFGIFAQKNGDKYECFYHDEPANTHSLIAKYSDLIKSQYNYDKDLSDSYISNEVMECEEDPTICLGGKEIPTSSVISAAPTCEYLYESINLAPDFTNRDKSQRFLTAFILSLFVCIAHIGLAIFGFLLFKSPNDPILSKFETVQNQI